MRGTGQLTDWDHPPNLPDIWCRRQDDVTAVLQNNVDGVIAQALSAAHPCLVIGLMPLLCILILLICAGLVQHLAVCHQGLCSTYRSIDMLQCMAYSMA